MTNGGLRERYANGELMKGDQETIDALLAEYDMHTQGKHDRKVLTADMDIYRYFGVVHPLNYDGDTLRAWLDWGHGSHDPSAKVRLWGIDTPEIRGGTKETKAAGRKARDYVREQVGGRGVIMISHKMRPNADGSFKPGTGKYGRYLFEVIDIDHDGNLYNLNERLVMTGMAELQTYSDQFNGWSRP